MRKVIIHRRALRNLLLACASTLAFFSHAAAQDTPDAVRTTYGDIGILEMPSARMAPDGQISATVGALDGTQRYNLGFQILPWLEASFRYSHISKIENEPFVYDRSFGLKIRFWQEGDYLPEVSLGIRDILGTGVYGSEYLVASKRLGDFDISTGLGWGRLASDDALPNPFGAIFPSFKKRGTPGVATGGVPDFGQFFHGPNMGVFGGIDWRSPVDGLDFLAEYSSDRYVLETLGGKFHERAPVNVGVRYRVSENFALSAGWFYASSWGLVASFNVDPTRNTGLTRIGLEIPEAEIRSSQQQRNSLAALQARTNQARTATEGGAFVALPPPEESLNERLASESVGVHDFEVDGHTLLVDARNVTGLQSQCINYAQIAGVTRPGIRDVAVTDMDDSNANVTFCPVPQTAVLTQPTPINVLAGPTPQAIAGAEEKIRRDIQAQDLRLEALTIGVSEIWVYYRNGRYFSEAEAAGRLARLLMADAPPSVEIFNMVSVKNGLALRTFRVSRGALERAAETDAAVVELGDAVALQMPQLNNPVLEQGYEGTFPRLSWQILPQLRQSFFDPSAPLQLQLFGELNASLEIAPGLSLNASMDANIVNNFNTRQVDNSVLPHVRSAAVLYYTKGMDGIGDLDATYRTRLAPDVFAEVRGGYLEDMFAGGGGQILWRPDGERFALGADMYEVWQRGFDRLFALQNYHVLTGHISLYYESPWHNLDFAVHAGRYLAGDYGATFEVTRRFSTGVEVGAFATFTNVPFSKFGEGSFDKGIIVRIPFEWGLPFYSQSAYNMVLRSIDRDGGQRLEDDDSLYEETRGTSYGEISRHMDEIITP